MKTTTVLALLGCLVALPALAHADGLPVTGLDGRVGVVSHDGKYRTVTFVANKQTIVARLHVDGGNIARYRAIPGQFAIPAVAYDSSPSGLSADGRVLALIRPRVTIPQPRTRLALLDAGRLLVRKTITLRGDFSLDAISPDGSKLYLIEYKSLSRRSFDPTQYAVRSFDTASGKLDPQPVTDPTEPDEKMGGLPVTRTMSADGRWAYTLYSGSEHPFVHALDTVGHTARCIDLDALTKRDDLFQMRLRTAAGGHKLQVVKDGAVQSIVDTRSFNVEAPRPKAPAARSAPAGNDDGSPIWPWALGAALVLLLLAASAKPLARVTRAR